MFPLGSKAIELFFLTCFFRVISGLALSPHQFFSSAFLNLRCYWAIVDFSRWILHLTYGFLPLLSRGITGQLLTFRWIDTDDLFTSSYGTFSTILILRVVIWCIGVLPLHSTHREKGRRNRPKVKRKDWGIYTWPDQERWASWSCSDHPTSWFTEEQTLHTSVQGMIALAPSTDLSGSFLGGGWEGDVISCFE